MKQFSLLFACMSILFLTGCVGARQESEHAVSSHALSTSGHIRWYQYHRQWFNQSGKPPAGVGGILYTIFTPSDWFWYGPYEETPKERFNRFNKKDCPGCEISFNCCIKAIKEKQEQINKLKLEVNRTEEIINLQKQIEYIDNNNGLGGDYSTPFKNRF